MTMAWLFVGTILAGTVISLLAKAIALARPARAWRLAAIELTGKVERTFFGLTLRGVVDGRPMLVQTVDRKASRSRALDTRVVVAARHPDDVATQKPLPPATVEAWRDAWETADIAAKMADLPRATFFGTAITETVEPGVCADAGHLLALVRRLARQLSAQEHEIARWRDAAAAVGMNPRAAWFLDGSWRGGWLRIVGDPASRATVVRARTEPRGADEDRWSGAAREHERRAAPASVTFDQYEVRVVLNGLEPDVARWSEAVMLATALAEGTPTGPYR